MIGMEDLTGYILAGLIGAILVFFGLRRFPSRSKSDSAPENTAAHAAGEAVQQTFEQEVGRVNDAVKSDSPADDLADLGNARRRR